jgi:DNA-binding response OmpR family regulator
VGASGGEMRLLLIEDEAEMASALRAALERRQILLDHASNLAEGEALAECFPYDAVILDRQLPDGDGLSLLPRLRAKKIGVPVLVLTARGDLFDRVQGLDHGADDYLAKPFALEELMARMRAILRRPSGLKADIMVAGRLTFDFVNQSASVVDAPLDLTRRELLVLSALLRHLGRMTHRTILMDAVFSLDDEVQPNALDLHVSRLRKKLVAADTGLVVNVVRGVGYLLREEA